MLPSIFGESLFDDWMDFPFRGFASDVDHKLYGKNAPRVMKTDLKEHDDGYELSVDLPGFKKDQIQLHLQNGYLTISAAKGLEEEGKDKNGRLLHRARHRRGREGPLRGRRADSVLPQARPQQAARASDHPDRRMIDPK